MHEMSLLQGVLEIIEDMAVKEQFTRVKSVWLEIGALSGVEPEAMRFCFDAVMHGTLAQGARLEIIDIPGRGFCKPCGKTIELAQLYDPCPHCQNFQVQPASGMEMRVKELEVE